MARWFKTSGSAANNRYIYEPAKHPGGGYAYDGGRGIDTLQLKLTAAEWAKPAVQAELAAYANFLARAPHSAKGEITGTFTLKTLNLQVTAVEKLQVVVAGKVVNPLNDAPVLKHAIADKTIAEDSVPFSHKIPAGSFTDVDNATLSYSAKLASGAVLPAWLKFNAATQTFTGTPPKDFNGLLDIKVTASDGKLTASDTFRLNVTAVNDAPVLKHAIADKTIAEDSGAFSYKVPAGTFSDVDTASLSFTATLSSGAALPAWLTFNAATQTFTGTPPANFNGLLDVKVTASDGKLSASDVFRLTVNAVNDAPVVAHDLADQSFAEDSGPFSFTLPAGSFTDVDSAALTYAATLADGVTSLPSWVVFDPATLTFSGTPPADFDGQVDIRVTASDGNLTVFDSFTLDLTPVNDAPIAPSDIDLPPNLATGGSGRGGGLSTAQTFVAGGTMPVQLSFEIVNNQFGVFVQLFEVTNGQLGNAITTSELLNGTGVKSIDLSGVSLVEGQSYAFVIHSANSGGSFTVRSSTVAYPDGTTQLNDTSVAGGFSPALRGLASISDWAFTLTYDDARLTVEEGGSRALTLADLPFTDSDSPNSAISFTVAAGSAPGHGHFERRDGVTTTVTSFTYAQVAAGDIFYVHNSDDAPSDSFSLSVSDGSSTSVDTIDVAVKVDDTNGFLDETFRFSALMSGGETFGADVTGGGAVEVPNVLNLPATIPSADFTAHQIIFAAHPLGPTTFVANRSFKISDTNNELDNIASVSLNLTGGVTNLSTSDITWDANNIYIDVANVGMTTGSSFTLNVVFG